MFPLEKRRVRLFGFLLLLILIAVILNLFPNLVDALARLGVPLLVG